MDGGWPNMLRSAAHAHERAAGPDVGLGARVERCRLHRGVPVVARVVDPAGERHGHGRNGAVRRRARRDRYRTGPGDGSERLGVPALCCRRRGSIGSCAASTSTDRDGAGPWAVGRPLPVEHAVAGPHGLGQFAAATPDPWATGTSGKRRQRFESGVVGGHAGSRGSTDRTALRGRRWLARSTAAAPCRSAGRAGRVAGASSDRSDGSNAASLSVMSRTRAAVLCSWLIFGSVA